MGRMQACTLPCKPLTKRRRRTGWKLCGYLRLLGAKAHSSISPAVLVKMYSLAAAIQARFSSARPELLVGMRLSSHTTICGGQEGGRRGGRLGFHALQLAG